jgi:hypothetical protein
MKKTLAEVARLRAQLEDRSAKFQSLLREVEALRASQAAQAAAHAQSGNTAASHGTQLDPDPDLASALNAARDKEDEFRREMEDLSAQTEQEKKQLQTHLRSVSALH